MQTVDASATQVQSSVYGNSIRSELKFNLTFILQSWALRLPVWNTSRSTCRFHTFPPYLIFFYKSVLWIRIRMDPHCFLVDWIRIPGSRRPKMTTKIETIKKILCFEVQDVSWGLKAFYVVWRSFLVALGWIIRNFFKSKNKLFSAVKFWSSKAWSRNRIWIRTDRKCWIRIRNETNADSRHCIIFSF